MALQRIAVAAAAAGDAHPYFVRLDHQMAFGGTIDACVGQTILLVGTAAYSGGAAQHSVRRIGGPVAEQVAFHRPADGTHSYVDSGPTDMFSVAHRLWLYFHPLDQHRVEHLRHFDAQNL